MQSNLRSMRALAWLLGLTLLPAFESRPAEDSRRPSAAEALAFLQSLPPIAKKIDGKKQLVQVWKDKTVQDIRSMKTLSPGGHIEGGAHLRLRGDDWKYFTAFEQLERAELWEIDGADDTAFEHLGRLSQTVTWLFVELAEVSDRGVRPLAALKNLQYLGIGWTQTIGDGAVEEMARIPSLEQILVSGCRKVTGRGVAALAALPRLKKLEIADTAVTDATLEHFQKLGVEELDLSQNKVTFAGLKALLSEPKNLPRLRSLTLKRVPLSAAEVRALSELRPGLQIVR